jgi:LysM repeat protein
MSLVRFCLVLAAVLLWSSAGAAEMLSPRVVPPVETMAPAWEHDLPAIAQTLTLRWDPVELPMEIESVDTIQYEVAPGDTVGGIARRYGVSADDIVRWNNLRNANALSVGQRLTIRTRSAGGERRRSTYTVRSGDTGGAIARRFNVTLRELQRWNPRANLDRLRIGQELTVYVEQVHRDDGGSAGAVGSASGGRLRGGVPLENGPGYRVRDRARAYGTSSTVHAIRTGIARVVARYVHVPALDIHDLSRERGGRLEPHRSHQNGLDVDISYYQIGATDRSPWRRIGPDELDVRLQWYLFRTWLDLGVVQYIFVDYALQEPLYEYARARGANEEQLEEWFEFPRRGSRRGIIRHEPGHADHFHARFVDG